MTDEYWMKIALDEAKKALEEDNIPVGAVLVKDDRLIAKAHNDTKSQTVLSHAEKIVIEKALETDKYLYDYTLYVTLEPCTMCAGSIVLSRIGRVVYATKDEKTGAVGSLYNILLDKRLNHNPKISYGVLKEEASELLKKYFREKR